VEAPVIVGLAAIVGLVLATSMFAAGIVKLAAGITPVAISCSETDTGRDYYVKGTTTVFYNNGTKRVEKDVCNGPTTLRPGTLREWYCGKPGDPAGLLRSDNYVTCPLGCSNGACTVNDGSLASVSFATSSAMTKRYVIGGSTQNNWAVYTIKAVDAPIIIDEMSFHVLGNISSYHFNPISALIINSQNINVINNYATATAMNLTIPANYGGINVVVNAVIAPVGQNANPSNNHLYTGLTYIKYHTAGGTVKTVYYGDKTYINAGGITVASLPGITISPTNNQLSLGTQRLANINLSADNTGSVKIRRIGLNFALANNLKLSNLVLKDPAGQVVSPSSGSYSPILFGFSTDGYQIYAGQTVTLGVYGTVQLMSSSTTWGGPGSEYVATSLTEANDDYFVWDDLNTSSVFGHVFFSDYLYGYPDNSVIITN